MKLRYVDVSITFHGKTRNGQKMLMPLKIEEVIEGHFIDAGRTGYATLVVDGVMFHNVCKASFIAQES